MFSDRGGKLHDVFAAVASGVRSQRARAMQLERDLERAKKERAEAVRVRQKGGEGEICANALERVVD